MPQTVFISMRVVACDCLKSPMLAKKLFYGLTFPENSLELLNCGVVIEDKCMLLPTKIVKYFLFRAKIS